MKLADLIKANHNIMLLLPRFGIPLGFGEKSVQDVCAAHNVPVDFMLLICNVYTFDDYLPDINQLAATNMQPLVPYLKESHRYYTGERLPHIEAHLHHIADRVEGKYGQILKQFYADFRREIEDHFKYEEQYDFPVLLSLQNGERRKRSQMSHSQRSHSKSSTSTCRAMCCPKRPSSWCSTSCSSRPTYRSTPSSRTRY